MPMALRLVPHDVSLTYGGVGGGGGGSRGGGIGAEEEQQQDVMTPDCLQLLNSAPHKYYTQTQNPR